MHSRLARHARTRLSVRVEPVEFVLMEIIVRSVVVAIRSARWAGHVMAQTTRSASNQVNNLYT